MNIFLQRWVTWSSIISYQKSGFLAQIKWILLSVSLDWTVDCSSKQHQSLCMQCVLPGVLWVGKVCNLSLEYLRLEQKALWPQWQGFLLKFNEDQLLFITRQQLGIPTEHKSDLFSKSATFILTYTNISLCNISPMWFREMFFPLRFLKLCAWNCLLIFLKS